MGGGDGLEGAIENKENTYLIYSPHSQEMMRKNVIVINSLKKTKKQNKI